MNYRFHPEADDDYQNAIDRYEKVARKVATRFVIEFGHTMARIAADPESYAFIAPETRALSVTGFPYRVIYVVRSSEVEILAVAHTSRHLGYMRHCLSQE